MTSWKTPDLMPPFNHTLRRLRKDKGVTHREIGEAIGLKGLSYQNAEHKPFKAMARAKVERLAAFYGLASDARDELLAQWEALPVSDYAKRQTPMWTARKVARSKARHHDAMQVALVELAAIQLDLVEMAAPLGVQPCTCVDPDPFNGVEARVCELCVALRVLGYPTAFNGLDPVRNFLASLQESLASGG